MTEVSRNKNCSLYIEGYLEITAYVQAHALNPDFINQFKHQLTLFREQIELKEIDIFKTRGYLASTTNICYSEIADDPSWDKEKLIFVIVQVDNHEIAIDPLYGLYLPTQKGYILDMQPLSFTETH